MFSKLDDIKLCRADRDMVEAEYPVHIGYLLFELAEEDERKCLAKLFTDEQDFYNSLTGNEVYKILIDRILARILRDESYSKFEKDLFDSFTSCKGQVAL